MMTPEEARIRLEMQLVGMRDIYGRLRELEQAPLNAESRRELLEQQLSYWASIRWIEKMLQGEASPYDAPGDITLDLPAGPLM